MRFSIRDVLWLTVVAGLATGWWADRCRVQLAEDVRVAAIRFHAEKTQAALRAAKNNQLMREMFVNHSSNPDTETNDRRKAYRRLRPGQPVEWEWVDRPIPN
jgi:hypothetical protein